MSNNSKQEQPARRSFIKQSLALGTAATLPYHFSASTSLGQELAANKPAIAVIGCGGMAMGNFHAAKQWLNLAAVSDVDSQRADRMNQEFAQGKAESHEDYRAILDRDDIKLVMIATPDHWHAKPLIEAMLAGKDVYCEKPLTLTIDEGKQIRKVQRETGCIVQVGTQQRSTFNLFVKAMALVQEGRLGKITRVQAAIGGAPASPPIPVADAPENINWDRWLGPAPQVDYRVAPVPEGAQGRPKTNCHYEFRWWYEYSGGKLTDWGAHHVDICNWALKLNGQKGGPVSIEGDAEHPVGFRDGYPLESDRYNTARKFNFKVKYAEGAELTIRSDTDNGVLIEGDKGRIFVNRSRLTGKPVEELEENPLPEEAISRVYRGMPMEGNERRAHWANFLHCVRERVDPISDVHSHMQMLNVCHLAGISARLGRGFKWDDAAEQIVGDEQANRMLKRPYREGYEIQYS